ncbi:hypothetical protein KCU77_g2, partial [Aureobasidium melanogenum]
MPISFMKLSVMAFAMFPRSSSGMKNQLESREQIADVVLRRQKKPRVRIGMTMRSSLRLVRPSSSSLGTGTWCFSGPDFKLISGCFIQVSLLCQVKSPHHWLCTADRRTAK